MNNQAQVYQVDSTYITKAAAMRIIEQLDTAREAVADTLPWLHGPSLDHAEKLITYYRNIRNYVAERVNEPRV